MRLSLSFAAILFLSSIVGLVIGEEGSIRNLKTCECDVGYVLDPNGKACIADCANVPPVCASISCPMNTACVGAFNDILGACICQSGYKYDENYVCVKTNDGLPFIPDECATLTCPTNSNCVEDPNSGGAMCVCAENFQATKEGKCVLNEGCVHPDCAAMTCPENSNCVEKPDADGAMCVCAEGYALDTVGQCLPSTCYYTPDACMTVRCSSNTMCLESPFGSAVCACMKGYKYDPKTMLCTKVEDGCLVTAPEQCASITCPTNSECVTAGSEAVCICASGYKYNKMGECIPNPDCPTSVPDDCAKTACPAKSECVPTDDGKGVECVCLPGFKKDKKTGKCVDAVCARVRCGQNARCIQTSKGKAKCVCRKGFIKNRKGICVKKK